MIIYIKTKVILINGGRLMKQNIKLIKIWGDIVEIKSLILSIIVSCFFTMFLYFLAPIDDLSKQLFYGLVKIY